jgi:hypothetical protein
MPYTSPRAKNVKFSTNYVTDSPLVIDLCLPTPADLSAENPQDPSCIINTQPDPTKSEIRRRENREHAADDSTFNCHPCNNTDYFSHDWQEDDICSTWKYLKSNRDQILNCSRLENMAWRTWAKRKHNLRTSLPRTINWKKENDVSRLYGPLRLSAAVSYCQQARSYNASLSRSNLLKASILKKRSTLDIISQSILSTPSSYPQEIVITQSQGGRTQGLKQQVLRRAPSLELELDLLSSDQTSYNVVELEPSLSAKNMMSDSKHIHFNDKVEQRVSVESSGECIDCRTSDSIMMKLIGPWYPTSWRRRSVAGRGKTTPTDYGMVAVLPPTVLRDEDVGVD